MADMKEASSLESITKVTNLCIGSSKSCEPVVSNTNCWNDLSLAAILKNSFSENCDLLDDITWLSIWIWAWEDISVVKENNFDTLNHSLVNS